MKLLSRTRDLWLSTIAACRVTREEWSKMQDNHEAEGAPFGVRLELLGSHLRERAAKIRKEADALTSTET